MTVDSAKITDAVSWFNDHVRLNVALPLNEFGNGLFKHAVKLCVDGTLDAGRVHEAVWLVDYRTRHPNTPGGIASAALRPTSRRRLAHAGPRPRSKCITM